MIYALALLILIAVFGGASYYVAHRLFACLRHFFPQLPSWVRLTAALLFTALLVLGFIRSMLPLPVGVKQVLGSINAYWMGIFIYLFLLFLLGDLVLLGIRLFAGPATSLRRCVVGLTALVLAFGVSGYGFFRGMQVETVSYDVRVDKPMDGTVHMVLLSDLHLGAEGSQARLADIVEKINALEPDLVCIAGDLFDSDFTAIRNPEQVRSLLQSIQSKQGVYACLGNHDAGATAQQMVDFVASCNITLLSETSTVIDGKLLLAGRLDKSPIGSFASVTRGDFQAVIEGQNTNLPVIVLDHNPARLEEYTAPADLILSGHTHKGQLFPANLLTGSMYATDYGYYRQTPNSPQLIVTSGAGTWGMPMRVGTQCEIVSITLHS